MMEPYAQELRPVGSPFPNRVPQGTDVTKQPLDALIKMHSSANRLAWGAEKGLDPKSSGPARKAAREFAEDLNGAILESLSPAERSLYVEAKKITQAKFEYELGQEVSMKLAGVASKSLGGHIASAVGIEALEKKYAPIFLEGLVKNNKMAYQKAISRLMNGAEDPDKTLKFMAPFLLRAIPVEIMDRFKEEAMATRNTNP